MEDPNLHGGFAIPESDYEYEYDDNETETFYVDIDLTSTNGPPNTLKQTNCRQTGAGKRDDSSKANVSTSQNASRGPSEQPSINQHPDAMDADDPSTVQGSQTKASIAPATKDNTSSEQGGSPPRSEIQIMSLDSFNPIISYNGTYFTCTWSDMIGTNLFFAEPPDDTTSTANPSSGSARHPPLLRGHGYDLQATSRVKLIGQKAKFVNRPGSRRRKRRRITDGEEEREDDAIIDLDVEIEDPAQQTRKEAEGKALGTLTSNNARTNRDIRNQANFLERLMDIKRKKGERDNVRTVFSRAASAANSTIRGGRRAESDEQWAGAGSKDQDSAAKRRPRMSKEEYAKEIEKLNRKVVRGDRDALFRLEEIYEEMEAGDGDDDDDDEDDRAYDVQPGNNENGASAFSAAAAAAAATTATTAKQPIDFDGTAEDEDEEDEEVFDDDDDEEEEEENQEDEDASNDDGETEANDAEADDKEVEEVEEGPT